jgi:hypothetical protein
MVELYGGNPHSCNLETIASSELNGVVVFSGSSALWFNVFLFLFLNLITLILIEKFIGYFKIFRGILLILKF